MTSKLRIESGLRPLAYSFALLSIFLCTSVSAQQKSSPEPALVVNGIPVEAAIRTIEGKTYVELDKIVKLLGLTVNRSTSVIVVDAPQKLQPLSGAVPSASTISGTLTYYFNRNYGKRPDTGAKVYLLSAEKEIDIKDDDFVFTAADKITIVKNKTEKSEHAILFQTAADGNGRFEFKAVPPGNYLLIAVCSHARGKSSSEILGKILKRSLEVKPGSAIDASHDFGMTYF